jgi:hypothetical protein
MKIGAGLFRWAYLQSWIDDGPKFPTGTCFPVSMLWLACGGRLQGHWLETCGEFTADLRR